MGWVVAAIVVIGGLLVLWGLIHFIGRFVGLMALGGLVLTVTGIIGLASESSNHSLCDSTLGTLMSTTGRDACNVDNGIYYTALVALVAGLALIVGAIIRRARTPNG